MTERIARIGRQRRDSACWWRSRRCEFAHASSLPESSSLPATLCRRRPAGESSPLDCRTAPQPQRAAPDLEPRSKKVCTALGSSGAWRCWRRRALVVRQSVGHVVVCAPWRMASLLGDDALIHRPTHITHIHNSTGIRVIHGGPDIPMKWTAAGAASWGCWNVDRLIDPSKPFWP